MQWLTTSVDDLLIIAGSTISIFILLIIKTRLFGLRTFAKMSSFDFAGTIAIGSILAAVALNTTTSIVAGVVAILFIQLFQFSFAVLQRNSKTFRNTTTNGPLLLMEQGKILYPNLKKSKIDETELIAKLREANVLKFSEVHAVVFESTGDISVLHGTGEDFDAETMLKSVNR